jgi:phosphate:Na+ symporter
MNFYLVLLHLAGAVVLLLWAVRMVRTGVERSYEPALRRLLKESKGGWPRAAAIGGAVAAVLQSSTAVGVLAASFAGSGVLTVATGIAMLLGADVGSALVVQVLSINLTWIAPVLLLGGGALFFKGQSRTQKQLGRILIGIALIFISLAMIGDATAPLRSSAELPGVVNYLRGDFVSAFLIGAAFAWLATSSVAAVLLIVTLASQGLVPAELAVSLMLGVNFGAALIPVGLTRSSFPAARRIAIGHFALRGSGALLMALLVRFVPLPLDLLGTPARLAANLHLLVNVVNLIVALPFCGKIEQLVERYVTAPLQPEVRPMPVSALDQSVIGVPGLALASATRELLRMAGLVEVMLAPAMELYETADREKIRQLRRIEREVDQAHSAIKLYLARIAYADADAEDSKRGVELSGFAINLEYVGDLIAKNLFHLAEVRQEKNVSFSSEGWQELCDLHHRVMANLQLALNVLVSSDRESAHQLLEEKDHMRRAERSSYARHLKRLQAGGNDSIETSDIHLETVRALKSINSLLAGVAYPILSETGDLLDSRLARIAHSN